MSRLMKIGSSDSEPEVVSEETKKINWAFLWRFIFYPFVLMFVIFCIQLGRAGSGAAAFLFFMCVPFIILTFELLIPEVIRGHRRLEAARARLEESRKGTYRQFK